MELADFEKPRPADQEVLVRPLCSTICGSDLHTIQGKRHQPTPSILGHEVVGVVEAIGENAPLDLNGRPLRPGARITWSVTASCFNCDRCKKGFPQKCRRLFKYGHSLADGRFALSGGLAEFVLLRGGTSIVLLNADLPNRVAAPANCATATVAACLRSVESLVGKSVLIFGAGMLGLTAAAFSKDLGAAQVVVVDPVASRLDLASKFGASLACHWPTGDADLNSMLLAQAAPDTYDVILELSGSKIACDSALRLADVGCRIVLAGAVLPVQALSVDAEHVIRQCITITGVHNYAPQDLLAAVNFLERAHKRFPFEALIAKSYSLDSVAQAIHFAINERPIRVAVES
ncbi:MAG: zinc-binding dehydrogenase [bacterium]|nr:zinc-binding dehydrogenase [bacterium]